MKPKYRCPSCHQEFSRRWNRERHVNTVHSRDAQALSDIMFYDNPVTRYSKPNMSIFDEQRKTEIVFEEIMKLYRSQYEVMESSRINAQQRRNLVALKSAQTALQQIYSNYVMIPKSYVGGISGFVCPHCVKFEAIHIKDLGYDRTMQHRHNCTSSDLGIVSNVSDYKSILPAVELEANETLFAMTKSWLLGASFLNLYELPSSEHISAEVYVLDATPAPWLRKYTVEKRTQIDDNDLKKFLALAKATYAIFNFFEGGKYFMYLSR